jgi:alkylation response protein AidB-like acyl-CoA dehydrogenase
MTVETVTPVPAKVDAIESAVRAAAPSWNTSVAGHDSSATFPSSAWRELSMTGIFGMGVPTAYDGSELALLDQLRVAEVLGHASEDGGLNFSAATHLASTAYAIERFGSSDARAKYLAPVARGELIGSHAITEADVGSDALAMAASGRIDGDSIIVDAEKSFVTNGPVADLTVVYVRTDADAGPLGLTAVVVPSSTPGFERGDQVEKSSLRTSPIGPVRLRDCRVPRSNVLGSVGSGFLVLDSVMTHEILVSFTINVGEMQRRLETTIRRVRERRQFGRPLAAFQSVQDALVEMHLAIDSSRLALAAAAEQVGRGERAAARVAAAKIITSKANLSTAQQAIELHGGAGVLSATGIERGLRDAMGGPIYSGTNAIQRLKIAKGLGL